MSIQRPSGEAPAGAGKTSGIRPLLREDLPRVVDLYEMIMRPGATRSVHLHAFFERTLFDHPWADPELPSLVYVDDDGEIVGFLGSSVRRMCFDGRPIRMVCSGHFLAHPRARRQAVGLRLMRACLAGPQDLTISDGSTDAVRRMWEALGGETVHLGCLSFIQAFRPWQLAADYALNRRGLQRLDPLVARVAAGFDFATSRVAHSWVTPEEPSGTTEPLTPEGLLQSLSAVTSSLRLYADYDRVYLDWLFDELRDVAARGPLWAAGEGRRTVRRGDLWAELVTEEGRVAGWYVCHLRRGGFCRVIQFAATRSGAETVFGQLAYRARLHGAAGIYGRVEPMLFAPLSMRRAVIRVHEGRLLAHARDREIVHSILDGTALLTRMDGEWW